MALQFQGTKYLGAMVTQDGVRLEADVYVPSGAGPFPVLLMRQPYGREIASTVVYAHPTWYAAQGYMVVIQDVRGRGTSQGDFHVFESEVRDGLETVNWAAQLPGSNGRVGMYGFSYQGMTQLYAAQAKPDALVAIAPAMVGYHPYADWAYENGALLLQAGAGWAIQLAAETARLQGDLQAYTALYEAARQPLFQNPTMVCPQVLARYGLDSFFHQWLAHPQTDAYWEKITPDLSQVDLPMLHIGGWFDPYLRGDIRLYKEMAARSHCPQPFWVGPWSHIPWDCRVGNRDFGSQAESPIDRLQVRWFDHTLKGHPLDEALSGISWFEMGTNRWRQFKGWPEAQRQQWCLASSGLASIRQGDGTLVSMDEDSAALGPPLTDDTIVHDPWRPVPALGGHAAIPAGVFDRASIDGRSDVLTYTTAPLTTPLAIAGEITVTLTAEVDRPSFDLFVTLSEVFPGGTIYPLCQGYGRFETVDGESAYQLPLQPTCFCLAEGQALRLSISAACFPAYAMNPGTGHGGGQNSLMDAKIITLVIKAGKEANSVIDVPVVPPLPVMNRAMESM
ncbi:MAG: CocE/NonD family hydrolase [Cyanobacteria bacterium]|nr:CocE/NonD family hydrolase [Cyanobacteriota bacterium]MDA0867328.1 CocE/NonD family hydrolase [Cyanobacteriota bacterium]